MATINIAHFNPTTENFGQLTLRSHRDVHVLPANFLIVLAFFGVLILAITGLAFADNAAFAHNQIGTTYYGGVPLDYD